MTIGRNVLKHAFATGIVLAVGGFAWYVVGDIEATTKSFGGADAKTLVDGGQTVAAAAQAAAHYILIVTLVAAALALAGSIAFRNESGGMPLQALALATEKMAGGDFDAVIEGEHRGDSIGRIARGLMTLRKTVQPMDQAAAASSAQEKRQSAHAKVIAESIERFSQDFIVSVQRLGAMTKRLGNAAELMIVTASHASDGSDKATTASSNAAGDVTSVASASEQLLDSIEEISRQVVQSTNVVRTAVERAVETNDGMGRLSSAAQKVGDVVSLISRIAAQTNLLALNATIEAARAGDAGRGFAVVAQEVKTLATQTAKATQDITGQIAEMLEATDLSVDAIDKIQKKISEVEHISTIIAAAVHEQGAATQEIARNVRSAAAGTQSMSSHIENVVRSVGETSTNASSISHLARELDEIASGMTDMVMSFTKAIKVA